MKRIIFILLFMAILFASCSTNSHCAAYADSHKTYNKR